MENKDTGKIPPAVKLSKASASDQTALQNMFQLYLHDLSEFAATLEINADGVFENNDIETYYEKDSLIPLMIRCGDRTAGFLLLNTPPYAPKGYDYYINDFFILRKYRGQGIGKAAANELFHTYPGKFAMVQLTKNDPAVRFWKRILIENHFEYEEKETIEHGDPCIFQGFQARA